MTGRSLSYGRRLGGGSGGGRNLPNPAFWDEIVDSPHCRVLNDGGDVEVVESDAMKHEER